MNNGCGCYPPDTNGAAGQNHYVQVVNAQFAAWTKTGTQVVPPTTINTLFPGTPHCGSLNRGDPVVVYDQFAQRFVISQFAFNGSGGTPPYWECTAVSATSDPTGIWCGYEFEVSPTKFNDYPKIGVWPSQNAFTMTANQFLLGASYAGVGIWAFERDAMLNCQTARFVYQDMEAIDPYMPATLPADADGDTPPPAGAPAPFVSINQDGSGLPQDQIQITNATVDWSGTPSITITHDTDIQAAPYDENLCDFGACIPQPGTTVKLQTLSDRGMWRAQYRNFGGWQTLVTSHSVDVGSDRAGARWYSIEKIGTGAWHMHDQGTFAPADGLNRWMPSAAMDKSGDIAVGYSTCERDRSELPEHFVRGAPRDRPARHARQRAAALCRHGLADRHRQPLGRLLRHVRRPGRRLHVLVHDRVHPDDRRDAVAHADRLLQVPVVRPAAGSAAAPAATSAAAPAATAPATARRVHDEHGRRDDHSGHDRPRHPLRRLLAPRGLPVPRPPLQPDLQRGGRQLERHRQLHR